jgi:membrane protein implicated in regulation of membrane protease activity
MNPWLLVLLFIAVALVWAWASDRRRRRRAGASSQGDSADALRGARAHADSMGRGDARDRGGF